MRLACNISLIFTEVPLENRFFTAHLAGFKTVEIQFPYEVELAVLQSAREIANVEVALINVPAGDLMQGGEGLAAVPGKEDEFKQAVAQCIEYATGLGVRVVNVLAGRCLYAGQESIYLKTFKKNLAYAASELQKVGILCTFEAINTKDMPGFLVHSSRQMLDILAELDHPNLQMQFDIYHMQIMDGHIDETLQRHAHQIGHIQFADFPGRGQPGTGNLNFKKIFELIKQSGYSGYVAAEYKPTGKSEESFNWLRDYDLSWLEGEPEF